MFGVKFVEQQELKYLESECRQMYRFKYFVSF